MGYTAKWGNKGFIISPSKVVALENLSTAIKLKTNSENDTSGTPTTNTRGRELQTISFGTKYLAAAGVDPRGQIDEWEAELGKSYPLYIGSKRFGPPQMMLTAVDVSDVKLTAQGEMISVSISVTLQEYDDSNTSALAKGEASAGSTNTSAGKTSAMSATATKADKSVKKPSQPVKPRMGELKAQ